jgi:hypothetical protein
MGPKINWVRVTGMFIASFLQIKNGIPPEGNPGSHPEVFIITPSLTGVAPEIHLLHKWGVCQ